MKISINTNSSRDWRFKLELDEIGQNGHDGYRSRQLDGQADIMTKLSLTRWNMESAAALAKEVGNWNEVSDFYRRTSELYIECGRAQPASDALAKGARALEDALPDGAIQLYTDACTVLEEDGKEQMAFDLYRAATSVYVKLLKIHRCCNFSSKTGPSS
ncbi:gamma-soluble NSF attachment protein-like [Salvia divinorum]|uniref:Gamma-soluble NSF attachment protein n=1 Tax=Salvia divinorum TaxID=28513 RepID=A0ABD1G2U1_SALDI